MRLTLCAGLCALLLAGATLIGGYAPAASSQADAVASAVADPARPEADRNRDAARKPVESLQFSGVESGDAVADFNASGGYFTRLFSDVVGSRGHVYAIEVEAAGFVFDSETGILANPADPRTIKVFDKSIQGHTDQFILKFRKPQLSHSGRET